MIKRRVYHLGTLDTTPLGRSMGLPNGMKNITPHTKVVPMYFSATYMTENDDHIEQGQGASARAAHHRGQNAAVAPKKPATLTRSADTHAKYHPLYCHHFPPLSPPAIDRNHPPVVNTAKTRIKHEHYHPGYLRYHPTTGNYPRVMKKAKRDRAITRGSFLLQRLSVILLILILIVG